MIATTNQFAVRPMFQVEEDYETYARIYSAYYPNDPTTADAKRETVKGRPANLDCRDYMATWDGVPAAVGCNMRPVWMQGENLRMIHYSMDPGFIGHPVERELLRFLIQDARLAGASKIITPLEDHHPSHVAHVEAEGFEFSQRQLVTILETPRFDQTAYQGLFERLDNEGVAIRSLQELRASGDGWFDAFYAAHSAIELDIPAPEPSQPMPKEEFRKYLDIPAFVDPRGMFVAFSGDQCLGLSSIVPNPADPSLGLTKLTGVRREHRRRGIATALKVCAISWAKSVGIERILTDNEEHNPMYKLNRSLGFEDAYHILVYTRDA